MAEVRKGHLLRQLKMGPQGAPKRVPTGRLWGYSGQCVWGGDPPNQCLGTVRNLQVWNEWVPCAELRR